MRPTRMTDQDGTTVTVTDTGCDVVTTEDGRMWERCWTRGDDGTEWWCPNTDDTGRTN